MFRFISRVFVSNGRTGHRHTCLRWQQTRTLLSDTYACQDVWNQRLGMPVLQKLDASDFAVKLQDKMDKQGNVSAVDIDILANKIESLDTQQLDFAQNVLYRFRQMAECANVLDSTSHALIRALLQAGETDRLLDMLEDKLKFGIFLDTYIASICMDHFIRHEHYHAAVRIAYDLMLQEDFGSAVSRSLAWYSCHLHWMNPPPVSETSAEEPAAEVVEEEEEKWVKVAFIQNPWYDDHWDLPTDTHRLGKTLVMLTQGCTDTMATSYHLIGQGLHQKFEDGLKLVEQIFADSSRKLAKSAVESFQRSLEDVVTKETPAEEVEPGLRTLKDVMPYVTAEQKQNDTEKLQMSLDKLEAAKQIEDIDLGKQLLDDVSETVKKSEASDISAQKDIYKQWEQLRQELLEKDIHEAKEQQKKIDIAEKLIELTRREEKLRYFEQEEKIRLGISRMPNERPIEEVKEEEMFVPPPSERGKGW